MGRSGVIQPNLQYNNKRTTDNETTELNLMQGKVFPFGP